MCFGFCLIYILSLHMYVYHVLHHGEICIQSQQQSDEKVIVWIFKQTLSEQWWCHSWALIEKYVVFLSLFFIYLISDPGCSHLELDT